MYTSHCIAGYLGALPHCDAIMQAPARAVAGTLPVFDMLALDGNRDGLAAPRPAPAAGTAFRSGGALVTGSGWGG